MKKSIFHFSIIVFLLTLITACNSGGGGGTNNKPSSTDTTQSTDTTTDTTTGSLNPVPVPINYKITITNDTTSPEATDILRTNTKYESRTVININNSTGSEQEITIPSISIEGNLAVDIASVQLLSDGKVLDTAVLSNGKAYFSSITLNVADGTSQKVTIQAKLNPSMQPLGNTEWSKKVKFGFTTDDIISSGAVISGLPMWGNYAYVEKGIQFYPCTNAVCSYSMETGSHTKLWGAMYMYPAKIVPIRNGKDVTFIGGNIGGVVSLTLNDIGGNIRSITGGDIQISTNETCSSWTNDSFDFTGNGDIIATTVSCTTIGEGVRSDVMLLKTDGSYNYVRITDDATTEFSPTIGSAGGVTSSDLVVLFAREVPDTKTGQGANAWILQTKAEIWKTTVNVNTGVVGKETLVEDNVLASSLVLGGYRRVISVNKDYTKFAFTRNVNGVPHIFITSMNEGDATDIGTGRSPDWATDGSNRILSTDNGSLYITNPDGTERRKILFPSNFDKEVGFGVGVSGIIFSAKYTSVQ